MTRASQGLLHVINHLLMTIIIVRQVISRLNLIFSRFLSASEQIGYGGLLKQIKQQLKLDDADNGDLVNVDGDY